MKDRIKTMLGNGLAPSVVATACGCSPSYISQLMSEDSFAEQVAELRFKSLSAATDRDAKADALEDALLAKIEELIPFMTKPLEVVRTYMALNGAKRRGAAVAPSDISQTQIIQLHLPAGTVANFQVTNKKEVIEVDGRTLVSLPAQQLYDKLNKKKVEVIDHVAPNQLPSPAAPVDTGTANLPAAATLA